MVAVNEVAPDAKTDKLAGPRPGPGADVYDPGSKTNAIEAVPALPQTHLKSVQPVKFTVIVDPVADAVPELEQLMLTVAACAGAAVAIKPVAARTNEPTPVRALNVMLTRPLPCLDGNDVEGTSPIPSETDSEGVPSATRFKRVDSLDKPRAVARPKR